MVVKACGVLRKTKVWILALSLTLCFWTCLGLSFLGCKKDLLLLGCCRNQPADSGCLLSELPVKAASTVQSGIPSLASTVRGRTFWALAGHGEAPWTCIQAIKQQQQNTPQNKKELLINEWEKILNKNYESIYKVWKAGCQVNFHYKTRLWHIEQSKKLEWQINIWTICSTFLTINEIQAKSMRHMSYSSDQQTLVSDNTNSF